MAAGPSGKYYNIYIDTCTHVNDPSDGILFVRIASEGLSGRPDLPRDDGSGGGESEVVAVISTIQSFA